MLKSRNKKQALKKQQTAHALGQQYKMRLDKAKADFDVREFESSSDDGAISVVVTGRREIKSLTIADELIAGDKGRLISTVIAVANEALILSREANIQLTTEVANQFNKDNGIETRSGAVA